MPSRSTSFSAAAIDQTVGAGLGDEFFPEQRAAAALHQVEARVDLVRAVDPEIEPLDVVDGDEGNADVGGERGRARGRGDAA